MKLQFRGWKRRVVFHDHKVSPVSIVKGYYNTGNPGDALQWVSTTSATGKVTGLALTGDFKIEFSFQHAELRNWLQAFIAAEPENAVKLLAEMQGEAIIALSKQSAITKLKIHANKED